jgi:hypothetical protein
MLPQRNLGAQGSWDLKKLEPHKDRNGPTPEALVQGRKRTSFEHFWNDFAADKTHSIPEADRLSRTEAYSKPGRMRAGWAYFASFQQTASDFAELSKTKLTLTGALDWRRKSRMVTSWPIK